MHSSATTTTTTTARSSTRAATAGPQKLYNKLISKINNFPHKSNKQGAKQQQQQSIVVPPLQSEQKKQQKLPVVNVVLPVHVVGSAGSGEHHHHDYENVLVVPSRVPESGVRGRRDGKSHHQKHEQQHNRHKRGGGGKGDAGNRMIPLTATAAKLFASESDKEDSCSLEDEIFEELEKVAHDEAKLCAALENFDKILSEYNDRGSKVKPPSQQQRTSSTAAKHEKTAKQHRQDHPKKILHKSKTCSIIESKCILKRASSDDESSLSSVSAANSQLSNVCLARSLLNLKDLEEFAENSRGQSPTSSVSSLKTSSSKMERVSVSHKYNTYKVKNSNVVTSVDSSESPAVTVCSTAANTNQNQSQLPRAKSVWDLGSVTPPNSHTPASRTNSGSKIPISTSSSRSNSFILSSGSTMSLLSVSAAKLNDCRLKQQSEVSNGNKIRSSTSTGSICVRPVTGKIQSTISEMSLRSQSKSYKKSKENGDELLNKCLEKGHEILKKVEELSASNGRQKGGKVKLTVKSTFQSQGLKSSTSSRLKLNGQDEPDGCRNGRPSASRKTTSSYNRKDDIFCPATATTSASAKYFMNSNDDISLHGHTTETVHHKSSLVATASCPTASTFTNSNNNNKRQNNAIVILNSSGISNRRATNNSATQTQTAAGVFESRSANSLAKGSASAGGWSSNSAAAMEQRSVGVGSSVKSRNIVKNCISNFENQCKTTAAGVSGGGLNGRNLRNVADSGGKLGKFRGLCSSAGAEKKPLHWKQSPSSISVLAIAPPPLKSPALVKQNKLCSSSAAAVCGVSSGKNASKHAEEELAVVAVKLSARQEEFTPTIIPLSVTPGAITPPVVAASSPVVPAAPTVTTTTVIVVPPSPLPPPVDDCDLIQEQQQQRYDDEKNVADELLLLPCVDPYRKREDHEGEEEDEEEEDGDEEEYDGEEERVIDHLKCVVNQKNAVSAAGATSEKEETYQSDCSDDSGHISNENNEHEENLKPIPGKLTESLLEIFEQNCKKSGAENSGDSTPTIRANHLYELCNSNSNSDVGDNSAKVAISGEPKKLFNNKSDAKLTTTHVGGEVIAAATTASPVAEEDVVSDKNVATSCDQIVPPRCDTEVLFRSGVLNQLEAKRDELLSDRIIQLQSYCRGHLARKRLAQRRVQELAVKCIQRNVRAFMKVREWPWWRLLVRVTPLLNVHRTEEQLKIATTELQVLKSKLEKVEGERNSLKAENSKLESRVSNKYF